MTSNLPPSNEVNVAEVTVESVDVVIEPVPTFSNNLLEPAIIKQSSNQSSLKIPIKSKDLLSANTKSFHGRSRSNSSTTGANNLVQMPRTPPDLKIKLDAEFDSVNLNQMKLVDLSSPNPIGYPNPKVTAIKNDVILPQSLSTTESESSGKDQVVELTFPESGSASESPANEPQLQSVSPHDSSLTLAPPAKDALADTARLPTLESMENLLHDRERFAYLGLVKLCLTIGANKYPFQVKEFASSHSSYTLFAKKVMQKLYTRLKVDNEEIQMIEKLSMHGVIPEDLSKTLLLASKEMRTTSFKTPLANSIAPTETTDQVEVAKETEEPTEPGETRADTASEKTESEMAPNLETVQVDLRWTILLDLFLVLTCNDTYDARSRALLYRIADELELPHEGVWKMEQSVADQLQICELADHLEHTVESQGRNKMNLKKRFALMGIASIGGGLIIGLSAGLMAPAIAAGLGVILTKVGVASGAAFFGSAGGIGLIASGGAAAGTGIAGSKMEKRTRGIDTFRFLPVEDRNRVNVVISVTGWLPNDHEDATLPFSVLDPSYGDHFSVLWEPKMLMELGNALRLLAGEVLSFAAQEILKQTFMNTLLGALAVPMALSKLGYLVDNPWSNGLDRARKAGLVLADVLLNHSHGYRPVTLVGFSLGARVIFYCLLELARVKAYGVVQDVFIFGSPVTASKKQWAECSGVVSGRFVNGHVKSDWILGFLYRASSASLSIAGLHPIEGVEGIENKDVTHLVSGHLAYRKLMPLLLKEVSVPVTSDTFEDDEAELPSDQLTELEASDNIEAVMSGKVQLGNVDKGIAKLPTKGTIAGAHKPSNSISAFFTGGAAKKPTHPQGSKSWLDSSVFNKLKWSSRSASNSRADSATNSFGSSSTQLLPLAKDDTDRFMDNPSNMTLLKMPNSPTVLTSADLYATHEKQLKFPDLDAPITAQVRTRPTNRFI